LPINLFLTFIAIFSSLLFPALFFFAALYKNIDFPFFFAFPANAMTAQLNEAKDKLASLTHSLKSVQVCGKGNFRVSRELLNSLSLSFAHSLDGEILSMMQCEALKGKLLCGNVCLNMKFIRVFSPCMKNISICSLITLPPFSPHTT
jgi:hypothetical protein